MVAHGSFVRGAVADPVEAWLRCGPTAARDTIVHGRPVVRNGQLVSTRVDEMLRSHGVISRRIQKIVE